MINYHIIIFLFLILSIKCYYRIIKKEEFFNLVRNEKLGKKYYIEVIDNLEKILKYYVYIELIKNPPQPDFDKSYYPKIDTIKYLEEIRNKITEESNSYDFYRDLKKLIDNYRDAHMSYGFRGFNYQKYAFLCPIKLITKINPNNETYSIGEMEFDKTFFRNGTEIFKIIEKNKNQPIKTINGKTPYEFIQTFGNPFMCLKNLHATYIFKLHQYLSPFVLYFPLDSNDITNFTLEYENGDSFETDFAIAEIVYDKENNSDKFFSSENIEEEFMNFLEKEFNQDYGVPKGLNEIIKKFEIYKGIKSENHLNNKINYIYDNLLKESESLEIKWDYQYVQGTESIFQCRVDKENKINVYHLKSFGFNDLDLAFNLLNNCINLFSSNEYNILVILDYNGGGSELFSQTMVEYIQPYLSSRFYSSFREGEYLRKYYDINFSDHSIIETCKMPDKNYLLKNSKIIDYGNNVINNITFPLLRFGQYRKEFNSKKILIKNKRKPTNILIFTDSYSASAASLFCKSL